MAADGGIVTVTRPRQSREIGWNSPDHARYRGPPICLTTNEPLPTSLSNSSAPQPPHLPFSLQLLNQGRMALQTLLGIAAAPQSRHTVNQHFQLVSVFGKLWPSLPSGTLGKHRGGSVLEGVWGLQNWQLDHFGITAVYKQDQYICRV